MSKYPLLISCHRSGSTWVQSYIREAYLTHWKKTLSFSNANNDDEFLDPYHFDSNINYKINFLKSLRERKFELCHKIHAHMLIDKNILNWFIDFYKDHDIIILKRRNLWKALLSFLFHNTIREKLKDTYELTGSLKLIKVGEFSPNVASARPRTNTDMESHNRPRTNTDPRHNDLLKSTIQSHNIKFKFDKNMCNNYLEQVRYLNTILEHKIKHLKPQLIFKEDINTEFLQKRFSLSNYTSHITPLNIKYDIYFKPDELEKTKQFFQRHYENEFKFYGYKYKY